MSDSTDIPGTHVKNKQPDVNTYQVVRTGVYIISRLILYYNVGAVLIVPGIQIVYDI